MSSDIYQVITDKIVAAIESGAGAWDFPWNKRIAAQLSGGMSGDALPVNVTGYGYRGVNVFVLLATADGMGYPTNVWGTFKQWQARGAMVRKGEKGTQTVFWKRIDRTKNAPVADDDAGEGATAPRGSILIAKAAYVFNAAQVEGYEPKAVTVKPVTGSAVEVSATVTEYVANTKAVIVHAGDRAVYRTKLDRIEMPPLASFTEAHGYHSTLLHELTHWSGHKDRCDRPLMNKFGNEAYAFEELIAELGAAFLCGKLCVMPEPRADHAAYIAGWLKTLKNDKRAIFTAASKAQKAVDYLDSLQPEETQERVAA